MIAPLTGYEKQNWTRAALVAHLEQLEREYRTIVLDRDEARARLSVCRAGQDVLREDVARLTRQLDRRNEHA